VSALKRPTARGLMQNLSAVKFHGDAPSSAVSQRIALRAEIPDKQSTPLNSTQLVNPNCSY
jgi:hypothetical protein